MKKCPQCGTQYSDVTLSFCLQDGTPLIVAPQADTPTVVLGETETVVPRRDAIREPVEDANAGVWDKSQVTRVATQPEKRGSNTMLAVLLTIVGMLILFGIIGIAAVVFWPKPDVARNSNNANLSIPNNNSISNVSTSPIQTAQTTPGYYTPRPSPPMNVAPPPVLSKYPPTTRLKFGRGGYSTSFPGDINPGDSRSLVLACRSGQSLSATLSGSSCVSIRGGGTSFRTTTSSGDNYVTVVSSCSATARFTITISVI